MSDFLNTNPKAYAQEQIMLKELKAHPDWIDGTELAHDWDKASGEVKFSFCFPDCEDNSKNASWENVVTEVINKHQRCPAP